MLAHNTFDQLVNLEDAFADLALLAADSLSLYDEAIKAITKAIEQTLEIVIFSAPNIPYRNKLWHNNFSVELTYLNEIFLGQDGQRAIHRELHVARAGCFHARS